MLLYLVRHGQTPQNKARRFQGPDAILSPDGEVQAGKVAERLKNLEIDEIWSSPMRRAQQTAEIINQYQNVKIDTIEELAELRRPSSLHGKKWSDPEVQAIKYLGIEHQTDPFFKVEDSESFNDLVQRARQLQIKVEQKAAEVPEDFTLLMTSHGIMLGTFLLTVLLGGQDSSMIMLDALKRLKIQNTGISVLEHTKDRGWTILTVSDYAHL